MDSKIVNLFGEELSSQKPLEVKDADSISSLKVDDPSEIVENSVAEAEDREIIHPLCVFELDVDYVFTPDKMDVGFYSMLYSLHTQISTFFTEFKNEEFLELNKFLGIFLSASAAKLQKDGVIKPIKMSEFQEKIKQIGQSFNERLRQIEEEKKSSPSLESDKPKLEIIK